MRHHHAIGREPRIQRTQSRAVAGPAQRLDRRIDREKVPQRQRQRGHGHAVHEPIVVSHRADDRLECVRRKRPQQHDHRGNEADDIAPQIGNHGERAGSASGDQQHIVIAAPDRNPDRHHDENHRDGAHVDAQAVEQHRYFNADNLVRCLVEPRPRHVAGNDYVVNPLQGGGTRLEIRSALNRP